MIRSLLFAVCIASASFWAVASASAKGDIYYVQKGLNVKPLAYDRAVQAFEFVQTLPIEYRELQNGCEARAHLFSFYLEKILGIEPAKIFVQTMSSAGFRVRLRRQPDRYVNWNYHVAPMVMIEGHGYYVLDATLFDRPVPANEWRAFLDVEDQHTFRVSYTDRFAYMPPGSDRVRYWRPDDLKTAWNTVFETTALKKHRPCAKKIQPVLTRWNLQAPNSAEILFYDSREGRVELVDGLPVDAARVHALISGTATPKEQAEIRRHCSK
jgi:hypothetical protein